MNSGILYGVSTGPGDPELMTVKAVRCIEKCDVIAAPRTKEKNCMALDIVKGIMDVEDKEILYLDLTMQRDKDVLDKNHRQQADAIERHLSNGRNVAMLNLGDASLYGSFGYIKEIVEADGFKTETIAGVNSFSAVAARLGQSLTSMNEPVTIIPGSCKELEKQLDNPGTKIIMKSGSEIMKVKEILEEKELVDRASMVADCGLKTEKVFNDIKDLSAPEGYFATILVH